MESGLAVRALALDGFVECSDGQLYHPVISGFCPQNRHQTAWKRKRTVANAAAAVSLSSARFTAPTSVKCESRCEALNSTVKL
ncbi:hypothetical protein ABIA45_001779 [Bradyrhizobium sp. USDA 336]